jgi:hypothetical protein
LCLQIKTYVDWPQTRDPVELAYLAGSMTTIQGFVWNSFMEVVTEIKIISKHVKSVNPLAVDRVRLSDIISLIWLKNVQAALTFKHVILQKRMVLQYKLLVRIMAKLLHNFPNYQIRLGITYYKPWSGMLFPNFWISYGHWILIYEIPCFCNSS